MTKEEKAAYNKQYQLSHKAEIKKKKQEYQEAHREEIAIKRADYFKKYELEHKEEISKKKLEYRNKNKEKIAAQKREYRRLNKEKIAKKKKEYSELNKETISQKQHIRYYANHKERKEKNLVLSRKPKVRYNKAIQHAKRHKNMFSLTFEQYFELINMPCFYCNNLLDKNSVAGVGLDRMNNLKGYDIDNVVSCCKTCNMIKGVKFTAQETKIMIDVVLKFKGIIK